MNICYSGGAVGADRLWGELALSDNQEVIHYSFKNHKIDNNFIGNECLYELSQEELDVSIKYLNKANNVLGRKFPTSSHHTNCLLKRNFFQIILSEKLYAISTLDKNTVKGGTAWAVQMFIDKCIKYNKNYPCYIFDMNTNKWYTYCYDKLKWVAMDFPPPKPNGKWTGIGSRDITEEAIDSVRNIFK